MDDRNCLDRLQQRQGGCHQKLAHRNDCDNLDSVKQRKRGQQEEREGFPQKPLCTEVAQTSSR